MRILSVSDYVVSALYDNFEVERFPKIDLILSCGDLPPEYLSNLYTSFNVPLYYVCGNHDIRYDSKPPSMHRPECKNNSIPGDQNAGP